MTRQRESRSTKQVHQDESVIKSRFERARPLLWAFPIWAAGAVAALLCTPSCAASSPLLKAYVELMSLFVDPHGHGFPKSNWPLITALYYSITYWSIPFFTLAIWRWMLRSIGHVESGVYFKRHLSLGNKAIILLFIPVWSALLLAATFNQGGNTRLIDLGTSTVHLALFGIVFPCGIALCISTIFFSFMRLFKNKETL